MPVSEGNSKVGDIPNFSVIPVADCNNCDHCKGSCYALKAWRMYPDVRKAWRANSKNAHKGDLTEVREYLAKKAPAFFRIHVAGDFFSRKYWKAWLAICRENPGTRFLAFTKEFWTTIDDIPENLSLVQSLFPGMDTDDVSLDRPVAFAGEPEDYNNNAWAHYRAMRAIRCPGKCDACGMCWDLKNIGKDVRFPIH